MNGNSLSSRGPAIALLETSSIAKGIEATDAMMKRAGVELLMTIIVPRGKYLVMVGGAVADAAVKAADVTLIEARNQPGAKGMVVVTGEVGAVRAAVAAGVATIKRDGMLIAEVVIPYAHEALVKSLTS